MTAGQTESPDSLRAALIIIGNEVLSGRTRDANLAFIGRHLGSCGIRLAEVRVVRDERDAIIGAVNQLRGQYDYVFTTGGIGPTHDDVTTECVAAAFGLTVKRDPEAAERLRDYYGPDQLTEVRLRMADVPQGAELIDNPVSAAPGFRLDNVIVLPGIPKIMQTMFVGLAAKLAGGSPIISRTVRAWTPESHFAEQLERIQREHPALDIGSYPFARENRFGTSLVVSGSEATSVEAALMKIECLLCMLNIEFATEPYDKDHNAKIDL